MGFRALKVNAALHNPFYARIVEAAR